MLLQNPNFLFSTDPITKEIAKSLYDEIKILPIISPHGHCDPSWFSENESFPNPANLFVIPDHYIFRMLFSQGISLTELGVRSLTDTNFEKNPRKIWQKFSDNYHLFRGTPTA